MQPRLVAALAGIAGAAVVLVAIFVGGSSSPCRGEVSDPADPPSHHDPELRTGNIGDKEILTSDGPLAAGMTLYIGDDTLYFVSGDGPACTELLAALP